MYFKNNFLIPYYEPHNNLKHLICNPDNQQMKNLLPHNQELAVLIKLLKYRNTTFIHMTTWQNCFYLHKTRKYLCFLFNKKRSVSLMGSILHTQKTHF